MPNRSDWSPLEIASDPEWREQKSDAARRNAEGVAKRLRTEVNKKFPLFADQIETLNPEQILERRRAVRFDILERFAEIDRKEQERIDALKAEVRSLVSPEEFDDLCSKEEGSFARGRNYWGIVKTHIQRRKDPIPDQASKALDFIRAWPGEPITHYELLQAMTATGDFAGDISELLDAVHWLRDRNYVLACRPRKCTVFDGKIDVFTWKANEPIK
jgi:hypothetical protein